MKKSKVYLLASLFLLAFLPHTSWGQQDTTEVFHFRSQQLVAPVLLVAAGAWGFAADSPTNWLEQRAAYDMNSGSHHCRIDEYIQYVPTAAHLLMGFVPDVRSRHNFRDRLLASATANLFMATATNTVKYTVRRKRPDSGKRNSYFSGHTATAFTGAELVRIEYGWGYGGVAYAMAATTAYLRLYNKRHWVGDVLTGAGIGILCADVGYWMLPVWKRLFRIDKKKESKATLVAAPFFQKDEKAAGFSCSLVLR